LVVERVAQPANLLPSNLESKEATVKKLLVLIAVSAVFLFLCGVTDTVYAGNGGNGNGFPEGDHFNLNLIAKKSDPAESGYFNCPSPADYQWDYYRDNVGVCTPELIGTDACQKCDPDVEICTVQIPSSQNVVFVPRDGSDDVDGDGNPEPITIRIKSGSDRPGKGKKIKDQFPSLTATDWCTEHFPDYGSLEGDEAEVMLPENANGYGVYARVTGKPVEGTAWSFLFPAIEQVQDEYGNDLYFMGSIGGPDGCTDAEGAHIGDLDRIDKTKGNGKGKGVKEASDLTCLFKFTGQVCYINDLCYYCGDAPDYLLCEGLFSGNDAGFVCCTDTFEADTQVFDSCGEPAKSNCTDPEGISTIDGVTLCDPAIDPDCEWTCTGESYGVDPLCRNYEEPTWVFNISDFVDVLWKSQSSGAYVVQLRFYPL
jgi:hypothetical protein